MDIDRFRPYRQRLEDSSMCNALLLHIGSLKIFTSRNAVKLYFEKWDYGSCDTHFLLRAQVFLSRAADILLA